MYKETYSTTGSILMVFHILKKLHNIGITQRMNSMLKAVTLNKQTLY